MTISVCCMTLNSIKTLFKIKINTINLYFIIYLDNYIQTWSNNYYNDNSGVCVSSRELHTLGPLSGRTCRLALEVNENGTCFFFSFFNDTKIIMIMDIHEFVYIMIIALLVLCDIVCIFNCVIMCCKMKNKYNKIYSAYILKNFITV